MLFYLAARDKKGDCGEQEPDSPEQKQRVSRVKTEQMLLIRLQLF